VRITSARACALVASLLAAPALLAGAPATATPATAAPARATPASATPARAAPVRTTVAPVTAGPGPARSAKGPERAGVTLLHSSTWVAGGGVFALDVVPATRADPSDRVEVTAYDRLYTRSGFDAAAAGRLGGEYPIYSASTAAGREAGRGVDLRIPVDATSTGSDLPSFGTAAGSGVYPLVVQLYRPDGTTPVGAPIVTFLVYDGGTSGFPKLSVSLTVPVGAATAVTPAGAPGPLPAPVSGGLGALASTLAAAPGVALSLQVNPETVAALAQGTAADRATVGRLAGLVAHGDELLPAPYVAVSLAGLDAGGLDADIATQLSAGSAALRRALGAAPDERTWVLGGATDPTTVQLLEAEGLRRFVTPDDALSGLPADLSNTTFARPAAFDDGNATPGLEVAGDDPTLSARVTAGAPPVLAAEQTLAEMAMIQLEQPSLTRGVAVTLPAGPALSDGYLATLLGGLRRDPFVRAVTAAGLFDGVPTLHDRGPVRTLVPVAIPSVPDAGTIAGLSAEVAGVASIYPEEKALVARMRAQLLVAPASDLPEAVRQDLFGAVGSAVRSVQARVRLPPSTSVTLTSLRSTLPMTITSDPSLVAHVQLILESPKLEFLPWHPSGGSCTVDERTTEICQLALRGTQIPLRIPVEARTSGVFTLDVTLQSADGNLQLASARDTVRSTAVSFVGLVIIVLALGFLAVWWIRDIRSGRRARRLVALPDDGEGRDGDDRDDGGDDPPGGGSGTPWAPLPPDPPTSLRPVPSAPEPARPAGRPLEPARSRARRPPAPV
jgi:hypothetical protein